MRNYVLTSPLIRFLVAIGIRFLFSNKYKFGARAVKNAPAIAPVRTSTADYLPLGQTTNLPEGRNRIGIIVGTFGILTEEIPEAAFECIDYENHPEERASPYLPGGGHFTQAFTDRRLSSCFCGFVNCIML